jgi:hypothetical protein
MNSAAFQKPLRNLRHMKALAPAVALAATIIAGDGVRAQENDSRSAPAASDLRPSCGGVFDMCGYVDRRTLAEVIPRRFEKAMSFSEGLAAVRIDGLYGYIDATGKVVIERAFDLAGPFLKGHAEVLIGAHTGVIDTHGNFVLPAKFARSVPASEYTVITRSGKYKQTRYPEHERLDAFEVIFPERGSMALHNLRSGHSTAEIYDFAFFSSATDFIWARKHDWRETPYGLMRSDGSWQVPPTFKLVAGLNEGRAQVTSFPAGDKSTPFWGAVDEKGEIVVPLAFEWLSYWQGGYAETHKGDKHGFVDTEGKLLGGGYFAKVERDSNTGKPWRVFNGLMWYYVGSNGEFSILPPEQHQAEAVANYPKSRFDPIPTGITECRAGASLFTANGLWGVKDAQGKVLIEAKHPAIDCFRNGLAWVPVESKHAWCPIGADGKLHAKPDCLTTYYPLRISHTRPEKLSEDPFESSVRWMQALLRYGVDPSQKPPLLLGDGVQGRSNHEIRCRSLVCE